jgi:hypothetical protein
MSGPAATTECGTVHLQGALPLQGYYALMALSPRVAVAVYGGMVLDPEEVRP